MSSATHRARPPAPTGPTGSAPGPLEPIGGRGLLESPVLPDPGADTDTDTDTGDGLRVWALETAQVDLAELDEARRWFDEEEREQAAAYVRAELRHAYEIAHATARRIVGSATGAHPGEIVWGRHDCPGCGEPHGRPRAEGADIEFSLAHTPGLILVAVSDVAVGVDVERFPDRDDLSGLAGVLHADEAAEVAAAAEPADAVRRFTRAWTRTEAYLKGVGIGLGRDPHLDYLGTSEDPERQLDGWRVRDVRVPEGYGAAVATVLS